jgi:hypothetical protein
VATAENIELETDPRFPSGPWIGFFLQREIPGRHQMELHLTFRQGSMTGEGRDWVGKFVIKGRYSTEDGRCYWHKRYLAKHDVFYQGYNEGKGIWGTWELPPPISLLMHPLGGFHIWPKAMGDPTGQHLTEEADVPAPVEPETVGV